MLIPEKKIIVCCSHSVTGGPELLHQLVHRLRENGRDAYMCYYPFDRPFVCPEQYKNYNAPQIQLEDTCEVFIILPESATRFIRLIKHARIGIWWLSVDNYLRAKHESKLKDIIVRYMSLIKKHCAPLSSLRKHIHFTQSHYASNFLGQAGIRSIPLSDCLNKVYLEHIWQLHDNEKENLVVYNPKKGIIKTNALIAAYPNIKFIPIQNMSASEVSTLLRRAKIYIDFGHHPGKDRPPREAAISGCCVITGGQGASRFMEDIPIPAQYKLNDRNKEYLCEFGPLAFDIFGRFDFHFLKYSFYRNSILEEPGLFSRQVVSIFGQKSAQAETFE